MKKRVVRKSKKAIGYIEPETEFVENGGSGSTENMNTNDPVVTDTGNQVPTLYNAGEIIPEPLPAKTINWPLLLAAGALLYFISKKS